MKTLKLTMYFVSLLLIAIACKKDPSPVTKPVEFNTTKYDTLGTYDNSGKPDNMAPADNVTPTLISFLDSTLPEKGDLRTTSPQLLTTQAIADVKITQQSDVYITFVKQGTKYRNTFAFYTYPSNKQPASTADISKITYVFPSAGAGTTLVKGDKVKIGSFSAGTSIGFVLLKDAWNATTHTVNSKAVHFCSNDVLNPEVDPNLKKHAVLINYPSENKTLIGFEDINRTETVCDHDFNDLLVYCTVMPQ
jgi:hypothetical protein